MKIGRLSVVCSACVNAVDGDVFGFNGHPGQKTTANKYYNNKKWKKETHAKARC